MNTELITPEFPIEYTEQRRYLLAVSDELKKRNTHMLLSTIHQVLLVAKELNKES